jgi:uncharacterized damage-inducible protein DinB
VIREQRAVPFEKGQGAPTSLQGVKGHALTAYQTYNRRVMTATLSDAFEYNRWANLRLLDACAGLSEVQLQLTTPGTYGTIQATLHHLLGAEQRYLRRLAGTLPLFSERDAPLTLAQLRREAERSGDALIELARRIDGDALIDAEFDGKPVRVQARVVLLQALHHGNDHRTHVCTILGSHGIDYEGLDGWSYGMATRALVAVSPSA